jgi:ABC-type glycerol-3-phosphate transport system substrate-binding protein
VGVSASSKHPAESWKLVQFLMNEKTNSELSTLANAFPGNTKSVPDFSSSDPLFKQAFDIYSEGKPANEFVGLPVAEQLMRLFDEQLQAILETPNSLRTHAIAKRIGDDVITESMGLQKQDSKSAQKEMTMEQQEKQFNLLQFPG